MSKFQEFCYLVVQRDKANNKRRRLLYALSKAYTKNHHCCHHHIIDNVMTDERVAYRKQADAMKRIAKEVYSPLRRELGIKCNYNSNNSVNLLQYQDELYTWKAIEQHANTYLFETIILSDDQTVNNAYEPYI